MSTTRIQRRDDVFLALGSPTIKPSRMSDVERTFENVEESSFDEGMEFAKAQEPKRQDEFLEKVLAELERTNPDVRFDRVRIAGAVDKVRGNLPF